MGNNNNNDDNRMDKINYNMLLIWMVCHASDTIRTFIILGRYHQSGAGLIFDISYIKHVDKSNAVAR